MPKQKRADAKRPSQAKPRNPTLLTLFPLRWAAALVLAVAVFYWIPLTSGETSIHRDAVDVHYSAQKFFDSVEK